MRPLPIAALLAATTLTACAPAGAQEIRRRVEAGPDGRVVLRYASRADLCGNANLLRIGSAGAFGETQWIWNRSSGSHDGSCERGPAQVLVTRAEGQVVSIRVGVGTDPAPDGATDLGRVGAAEAAGFFLELAARADGRLGRDALLAAAVTDSADLGPRLLALARNGALSRGLRESATSWLGRELGSGGPASLIGALVALARDAEAPVSVRSRAASALAHAGPAATSQLVALAASDDPAVAKAALSALGRSGDPRAREAVRRAAQNHDLSEPARVQAIRSLGGSDATPSDVAALRALWPTLQGDQTRGAVLDVLAGIGGSANAEWTLAVAANDAEPSSQRARAVRAAEQAGAGSTALIRVYDRAADRRVKDAILDALARIGDRTATEKLATVAREDTDPNLRRSALRRLARLGGDDARDVLEAVVERP